jgi:hypothetical protein
MKKSTPVVKPAMKASAKSLKTSAHKKGRGNSFKGKSKKNFFKDVPGFRWLKKALVRKTQEESLDLLDRWILKKKALGLFS